MKLIRMIVGAALVTTVAACATGSPRPCTVMLKRVGTDFVSKIPDQQGEKVLFIIGYDGDGCTVDAVARLAAPIFLRYQEENGYSNFVILRSQQDYISGYRYVVLFRR